MKDKIAEILIRAYAFLVCLIAISATIAFVSSSFWQWACRGVDDGRLYFITTILFGIFVLGNSMIWQSHLKTSNSLIQTLEEAIKQQRQMIDLLEPYLPDHMRGPKALLKTFQEKYRSIEKDN